MKEMTVEQYFNSKPKGVKGFSQRLLFAFEHRQEIDDYIRKIVDERINNQTRWLTNSHQILQKRIHTQNNSKRDSFD